MVTDAVTERPEAETAFPYAARLLLTLAVLALYWFGHRVPLPLVNPEIRQLGISFGARVGVLVFETTPLWTGFCLVELFALATSAGRRLRRDGLAGRAKLNRAALIVSLTLAALQAASTARYLESMSLPDVGEIVPTPGIGFSLITIVTLTATTAALYAVGQFLSAYGVGNGFALLALTSITMKTLQRLHGTQGEIETGDGNGFLLMATLAILVVVTLQVIRKSEDRWTPAFPQSVLPALAVAWLWPLIGLLKMSRPAELALAAALILTLSWIGFHLFSSRSRLSAALSEPEEVLDGLAADLRRQAGPATALLVAGMLASLAWQEYAPSLAAFALDFPLLVLALAIGLDLWDQYRFEQRCGRPALLARLDDVHFSYRLEERLQEEEIAALARGHHFRSLFFFFGALYKIDVLVPEDRLVRAREVMAELEMAREIKAF